MFFKSRRTYRVPNAPQNVEYATAVRAARWVSERIKLDAMLRARHDIDAPRMCEFGGSRDGAKLNKEMRRMMGLRAD